MNAFQFSNMNIHASKRFVSKDKLEQNEIKLIEIIFCLKYDVFPVVRAVRLWKVVFRLR